MPAVKDDEPSPRIGVSGDIVSHPEFYTGLRHLGAGLNGAALSPFWSGFSELSARRSRRKTRALKSA